MPALFDRGKYDNLLNGSGIGREAVQANNRRVLRRFSLYGVLF
jgi:hypothetical protein